MTTETARKAANILYQLEDVATVFEKIEQIEEIPSDLYHELEKVIKRYENRLKKELQEL